MPAVRRPSSASSPNSSPLQLSSIPKINRDKYGDTLSPARRAVLLGFALLFIIGCAVLSLILRAVPKTELGIVTAAVLYVLAASTLQTNQTTPVSSDRVKPLARDRQLSRVTVRIFLVFSLLVSLLIPWIWLLCFRTTLAQRRMLGPHLFLMMAQVLFEIWSYRGTVSLLIRIVIPVAFVSYRIRLLVEWVRKSALVVWTTNTSNPILADRLMLALAVINLVFWAVVLFYVLLLKVCPPYFLDSKIVRKEDVERKT